jgi:hypothetical protein
MFDLNLGLFRYLIHGLFVIRSVVLFVVQIAHEKVSSRGLWWALIFQNWFEERILEELIGLDSYPCLIVFLPVDKSISLIIGNLLKEISNLSLKLMRLNESVTYPSSLPRHFNLLFQFLFSHFFFHLLLILYFLDHLNGHPNSIQSDIPEIAYQLKPLSFL